METMEITNIKTEVAEIVAIFTKSLEGIKLAGEKLVKLLDSGVTKEEIYEASGVAMRTWETLEAIGRGTMDSRLLMGGGVNRSNIKRLPLSDQRRIMDGEKLTLVLEDGDSIQVDPMNCEREQAKQLFQGSHIRTESEQRAYIEQENSFNVKDMARSAKVTKCWVVDKGTLYVDRGVISKEEIKQIMQEMM